MNDFGTVKLCVSRCGNNKKYAFDAGAYGKMSDTGLSEGIVYPDDEGVMQHSIPHTRITIWNNSFNSAR